MTAEVCGWGDQSEAQNQRPPPTMGVNVWSRNVQFRDDVEIGQFLFVRMQTLSM